MKTSEKSFLESEILVAVAVLNVMRFQVPDLTVGALPLHLTVRDVQVPRLTVMIQVPSIQCHHPSSFLQRLYSHSPWDFH